MYQEAASSINYSRRDQCESIKEKKSLTAGDLIELIDGFAFTGD